MNQSMSKTVPTRRVRTFQTAPRHSQGLLRLLLLLLLAGVRCGTPLGYCFYTNLLGVGTDSMRHVPQLALLASGTEGAVRVFDRGSVRA